MSAIRFALFAGSLAGLFAVSHPAFGAADSAALCADVAGPKAMVAEHHGRWIELSAEQRQFLRGVYAMNSETAPGLPYGDHGVLARFDDMGSGIVFFIHGDRACPPMSTPPELLSLMKDVESHTNKHEGAGFSADAAEGRLDP